MKNTTTAYERPEIPAETHELNSAMARLPDRRQNLGVIRSKILRCAALVFAGLLLAAQAVFAGGGPAGVVVVYDLNDPRSVTIANEYQQVRGVPERNMVPYAFPTSFSRTTAWDFVYSLRATLKSRGLEPQLQSIALAGVTPLDGAQTSVQYATLSLHSFLYLSPNFSGASIQTCTTF